ncbi:MAG: hypothetical protein ACRD3E_03585, partial [Terriglobales bacterium]
MSRFNSHTIFAEAEGWDLWDVNVRVGPSGIHGELALDKTGLLQEMDRYFIRTAVAAHGTAIEYDADQGNEFLSEVRGPRLVPAWTARPERKYVDGLRALQPRAVRLSPGRTNHNFPLTKWGAGELFEFLQAERVVTLVAREDIEWNTVAELLENFPRLPLVLLDTGYRADTYLYPLLDRFPTLSFDSATYLAHRQLESYVDQYGPERILFGSRLPFFTPASA